MIPRTVRLHFLVFFPLGILASDILFSQTRLRAQVYNMENGLSHSQVNECYIDRKGVFWVGTRDGLNRYDGYHFEIFRHKPLDSTSISDKYINTISEDAAGRLWVGTRQGLNIFDPGTGEFKIPFEEDRDDYNINASLID